MLDRGKGVYTAAEERWIQRREELEDQPDLSRFLAKHADVDGGETVEGAYPTTSYLLVRLTRPLPGLTRHSRFPRQLRPAIVAHTERELDALATKIEDDAKAGAGFFDGWGRAGFLFLGDDADVATGTVQLRIVTARPDAPSYFAARYGPLAQAVVTGDRFECPS